MSHAPRAKSPDPVQPLVVSWPRAGIHLQGDDDWSDRRDQTFTKKCHRFLQSELGASSTLSRNPSRLIVSDASLNMARSQEQRSVSVVTPVYNGEASLGQLCRRLAEVSPTISAQCEVILGIGEYLTRMQFRPMKRPAYVVRTTT